MDMYPRHIRIRYVSDTGYVVSWTYRGNVLRTLLGQTMICYLERMINIISNRGKTAYRLIIMQ